MDIKDLNKPQLILLALLLSFVTSIATGITTVTLMQQAPQSVIQPITKIVRETVEKIVQVDNSTKTQPLSPDQQKLLEELKAIQPLTVSLFSKGAKEDGSEDKLLGTGLFLGEDKVVIASLIPMPKEGEVYIVKSILGEKKITKVIPEKDFTIIELAVDETAKPGADQTTEQNVDNTETTATPPQTP